MKDFILMFVLLANTLMVLFICFVTSSELCIDPLGLEDGTIPNDQLTASSTYGQYGPHRGRVNTPALGALCGCWAAGKIDQNQWIQVDLGTLHKVCGVITQGRNAASQWVTSYKVFHSFDGNAFEPVTDSSYRVTEFVGNSDRDTAVTNIFNNPVYAQFIRINPISWSGFISMRFEVLGCRDVGPSTYYKSFHRRSACQHRSVATFINTPGSCMRCAAQCMRTLQCKAFNYDNGECHFYSEGANEYYVAFQLGCRKIM